MKWMMAFMTGNTPKLDADGWMWMLHGDVGEDNSKAGVLNEKDSTPGQWIESGPHLMLMPKDPSSLDNMNTDFFKWLALCNVSKNSLCPCHDTNRRVL